MNTALPLGRRPCFFSHALTSSTVTALSSSLLARPLMSMTAAGTIRLRTGICSRDGVLAMKWQGASMCVPLWSMSSHLLTYTPNFSRVAIAVILIGNVRPGMGMTGNLGERVCVRSTTLLRPMERTAGSWSAFRAGGAKAVAAAKPAATWSSSRRLRPASAVWITDGAHMTDSPSSTNSVKVRRVAERTSSAAGRNDPHRNLWVKKLALAAGGQKDLPRQPTGLVGGQEHRDRRDVRGLPDAAEGRHGNHLLLEITPDSDHAGRASALGCRRPGVDGVHSNLSRPQLLREHPCDCVEGTLGCRVDRQVGRGQLRRHRADVDDAATPRPEVLHGLTNHQKGTEHVRVELPVEFFLGHRLEWPELVDRGIVHKHVQRAVGRLGLDE